jgi:hypothetical protein
LILGFARLDQFLDLFILFSLVLEGLSNVGMESFKVTIYLFKREFLNLLVVLCTILSECLNVNIYRIEILRLLVLVKFDLVALDLSLAKGLRDLELHAVKKLLRHDTLLDISFWNKPNKEHQRLIELSLSTHYVEDLLHVRFELNKSLSKLCILLSRYLLR